MTVARDRHRRAMLVLGVLGLATTGLALAFMTVGARGNWGFVLGFRGSKLAGMLLVGSAVATATVLFQTATGNRILTPAVMGFDALYLLIQTGLVFAAGTTPAAGPRLLFVAQSLALVLFATALYRWLLRGRAGGLHLLLLVGVVCGALFRSLALLLQRLIAPNEFVVVQARLFASFNAIQTDLLALAALAVGAVGLAVWRLLPGLDVMLLGREAAIGLGHDHDRALTRVLVLVSVLTAVSTALVGPITFLGLLAANLAYRLVPSHRHALLLPAACLLAAIALLGGQLVLERVLGLDAALGMIIEFAGGIVFMALLLGRTAR